jgi:hypothetical protein
MKTIKVNSGIKQGNYTSCGPILRIGIILVFILCTVSVSAQQSDLPEDVKVWAVPAEQKVRPADRIENNNLVWSGETRKISVAGAGNEHVPFQVVISTPVPTGRRSPALGGFFIKTSDLFSASGKIIPQNSVNLFFEHYIQIYAISSPVGATGYWPDALAPLKEPFSMTAQYTTVANRPIWVDIHVPPGTPAGVYKGTLTVTRLDKVIETINVEVEVYNFTLPEETHLITYFNISRGQMPRPTGQQASPAETEQLTLKNFEFLYAHRMESWRNNLLVPQLTVKGENVELKFNDSMYEYFMNKLKTKRVVLEARPGGLGRQPGADQFSPAYIKMVKSYFTQVEAYFRKHGWKDRLVFNSPVDEPNTKQAYDETRRWAELVHETVPGIPFLATESPVTDNPEWGTLRGYVNNFCVHGNSLNSPAVKQALIEEQEKGGEATWYISCDQAYPQPNYFIDAPALDPVMVPWITARYHMNGILYWATNYWSQTTDPWLDPVTFISGFDCSGGYVLNGEGSLIYPGDRTRRYTGQPEVAGPVSSIRLELLREGIEDYEYMWLLKDKGDSDFAEKQVRNMVIDVSSFSRNLEELYLSRKAMARRLEELVH